MLRLARHPLATSVICIAAALIGVGGVSSTLDRQRLGFHGERAYAAPLVLLAIAWSQVFVSSPWGRYSLAPQHRRLRWHSAYSVSSLASGTTSKRMPTA